MLTGVELRLENSLVTEHHSHLGSNVAAMSRLRDRRSTRHFDDIPDAVEQSIPGPSKLRNQVPVQPQQSDRDSARVGVVEDVGQDEDEDGDETWDNFTAEYYEGEGCFSI